MFESILRHKQVVIAAIAITALAGYGVPLNQFAAAQDLTADDIINQDATATSNPTQSSTIEAPNTQTNAIVTGDANAEQTNTATSEANAFSAAFGGSGGDAGCSDCDKKDKKKKVVDKKDGKKRSGFGGGSSGGDGGDASSTANAASSAEVSGNINVADTSADNNVQTNTNTQSFDVDQDQRSQAEVNQEATLISENYVNLRLPLGND